MQKYYVSPEEAISHKGERHFENREQFKVFIKKLATEQRKEIMEEAEKQGVKWDRSNDKTDWMRAAMAIGKLLENGTQFKIPEFKATVKAPKAPTPQQPKPQTAPVVTPTASTSTAPSGVFATRDDFKAYTKKLTTEQRQSVLQDALSQGLTWTRVTTNPGTDWMRCAMAIGSLLEKGGTWEVGKGTTAQPAPATAQPLTPTPTVTAPSGAGNGHTGSNPTPAPSVTQQPAPVPNPAQPLTVPTNPTPKIDQLFAKAGLATQIDNGNYIVGDGLKHIKNKWGKDEIAPGHIGLKEIKPIAKFGPGNYIKLDSAFLDKDKLKKDYDAKWGGLADPNDKNWYIPFKDFIRLMLDFKNVTIDKSIAPTIKAVIEKVPDLDALIANSQGQTAPQTISAKDNIDISNFQMPKGMNPNLSLYDHQKKGIKFMIQNRKATLGLAVGLGKTLSAITATKELINSGEIKRVVVIAPASVKYNWKNEVEGFSDMKACVLDSNDLNNPKKADAAWAEAMNSQVIIVNYDMLRKDEIRKQLVKLAPDCVIADEAHKLKNDTQQTKGFKEAWKSSKYKWFLTATPFPNGQPKETYNMLSHLRPDKVGSWTKDFGRKYVVWESAGRFGSKAVALKNTDKLAKEMEDVVFMRTHNSPDVTSTMPKERHTTFNLEMEKDQKKMYEAIAKDISEEIKRMEKAGIKASAPMLLAKMKRLEQVGIDPDMLQEDKSKINMNKLYPKEEWAVNTITDHLDDPKNRGVVLFCDMKLPLDKIKQGLINQGLDPKKIAYITGDVKPAERTAIQDKMKNGDVKVVLCTNAAEEGVNLQHGAHTLIHLDVPWVPKSITQREGRVLRQGQPNAYASFLTPIMKGTVEDTKRGKLGIKVSTIESLLGRGSAGSSAGNVASDAKAESLSLKDIKSILGV